MRRGARSRTTVQADFPDLVSSDGRLMRIPLFRCLGLREPYFKQTCRERVPGSVPRFLDIAAAPQDCFRTVCRAGLEPVYSPSKILAMKSRGGAATPPPGARAGEWS